MKTLLFFDVMMVGILGFCHYYGSLCWSPDERVNALILFYFVAFLGLKIYFLSQKIPTLGKQCYNW